MCCFYVVAGWISGVHFCVERECKEIHTGSLTPRTRSATATATGVLCCYSYESNYFIEFIRNTTPPDSRLASRWSSSALCVRGCVSIICRFEPPGGFGRRECFPNGSMFSECARTHSAVGHSEKHRLLAAVVESARKRCRAAHLNT